MSNSRELKPEALYTKTDPDHIPFDTTAGVEGLDGIIGQSRAVDAIKFGTQIDKQGFNLFVLGPSGIGKQSMIQDYLDNQAQSQLPPDDWCYVNNFAHPHKPYAIRLQPGKGQELCDDIKKLISDARTLMPVEFESDEYRAKLGDIEDKYETLRKDAFDSLVEEATAHDVSLIKGPRGFILGPVVNGKVIDVSEFKKLPEDQQEHISEVIEIFEEKLSALIHKMPSLARDEREEIDALNHDTAAKTVESLVSGLLDKYKDMPDVCRYLNDIKNDIASNIDDFIETEQAMPDILGMQENKASSLRRYEVNLLVDNSKTEGAPVLYEDNPVYQSLVGRIEHQSKMGALFTDFTLIKPGALQKANGGYLVLDARKVLMQPFAWDALKRTLYSNQVCIQSLSSIYGIVDTVSLEPEPIPLDLKVVLLGDRILYYMLLEYDPDFKELFKVAADFEDDMQRSKENVQLYAKMIATLAGKEELLAFDKSAVSRIIEHSARLANDSERLTTHMLSIVDLMRESEYWATKNALDKVNAESVEQAIAAQVHRSDRVKERLHDEIQRGTILIDTAGEKTGSVNGLAVIDMSNYRFAHPMRITATTRLGDGEIIDIEREAELGGALHSKGVLILSSFLSSRYTKDLPLSMLASLTFEQSYGMVDGDSASTAELCALLSSLADAPVHQNIAITGSVNQLGQVQAIGGVNEKIEGFFDVCNERGLQGEQGVIIPQSNVKHLMLRHDVVEAVENGQFHIYSVETVDQAIEILTGVAAGEADAAGKFPEGSINFRAEQKLVEMSASREKHTKSKE